jgi:quercetin dioxygenase-like cupin family protein
MKVFRGVESPSRSVDTNSFIGTARTKLLASDEAATPVHVYRVEFESGARTNWHTHSGPQWLLVIDGRIRAQVWGHAAIDVDAGDAIVFAPGEKHWHGAVPGTQGTHLAVNVNVQTEWLEPVTDREYNPS